ncbi:MAG: tetratricopeptide repeat protein [Flammeovirgaceae bacterium]|nr:tetratricopeptide repeat protein [Flammeovirgaceae bacterium]
MRRSILLLVLILSACQLFGQGDNKFLVNQIDSLKRQLPSTLQDSTRAETLRLIASSYMHINPDSSIHYAQQAIRLFEKTKNFRKRNFTKGQMMEGYIKQGNLPKALEDGLNTLEEADKLEVRESGIGSTNDNLGLIYYYLGNFQKSLYYYEENILRGDVDLGGEAFGYLGQALVFEKLNKLDSALLFLEKSRNAFHQWNNISNANDIQRDNAYQYEVYPAWYNVRAKIYLKQNRPDLALADLRTTLAITLESTEIFHTSNTYNDIADYYKRFNQKDSVIYYAERGLAEANKISFIEGS